MHILVSLLRTVIITAFQPSDSAGESKLTFRIALVFQAGVVFEKAISEFDQTFLAPLPDWTLHPKRVDELVQAGDVFLQLVSGQLRVFVWLLLPEPAIEVENFGIGASAGPQCRFMSLY